MTLISGVAAPDTSSTGSAKQPEREINMTRFAAFSIRFGFAVVAAAWTLILLPWYAGQNYW